MLTIWEKMVIQQMIKKKINQDSAMNWVRKIF